MGPTWATNIFANGILMSPKWVSRWGQHGLHVGHYGLYVVNSTWDSYLYSIKGLYGLHVDLYWPLCVPFCKFYMEPIIIGFHFNASVQFSSMS